MEYQIELHPVAELEFWEAVDWYDDQKEDLGKLFAREFERLVSLIQKNPLLFPLAFREKRKAVFSRFPYFIVFEIRNDVVYLLAVFHSSRDSKNWQNR